MLLIIDISKHRAKEMGLVKMARPGFVNDVTAWWPGFVNDVTACMMTRFREWCYSMHDDPVSWMMLQHAWWPGFVNDVTACMMTRFREWCYSMHDDPVSWMMLQHAWWPGFVNDVTACMMTRFREWCYSMHDDPVLFQKKLRTNRIQNLYFLWNKIEIITTMSTK